MATRQTGDSVVSIERPPKVMHQTPCKSPLKSPQKSPQKSPHKSPGKSPHKSPGRSPHKSPHKSPGKSSHKTSNGLSQPINSVVVPCFVEEDQGSSTNDTAENRNFNVESGSNYFPAEDKTREIYEDITGASTVKKKKAKAKKKTKKSGEEKTKRKKGANGIGVSEVDRHSDDELEDLLFTKTDKETKFEEVFHDSDLVSMKHNLPAAVVDVELKVQRPEPVKNEYPDCQEISPANTPNANMDAYGPEAPRTASTNHFAPLQPPPPPPAIPPGFLSTIPFLSMVEKRQPEANEAPGVSGNGAGNAAYSPVENPLPGLDYNSSPENPSTVHLSDISNKESTVESAVGIITPAEKIEDFLDRMPGSFPKDTSDAVDMDMSPTNGISQTFPRSQEDDDDIIEQLHKEFVRSQNEEAKDPEVGFEDSGTWGSDIYEPGLPSPVQGAAEDSAVVVDGVRNDTSAFGGAIEVKQRVHHKKRHRDKKEKNRAEFAKEKKDIEVGKQMCLCWCKQKSRKTLKMSRNKYEKGSCIWIQRTPS